MEDRTQAIRNDEVRRDFVANVSHELKTPLTVIRGHSETLLDETLPPDLRRTFARAVRTNADRLHRILEDLLDLSRIESGGWRPNPEVLRLEELVREAWHPFAAEAEERNVAFRGDVSPEAEDVAVDPGAIRQVFSNLFSNALRHTPDGGEIRVRARGAMVLAVTPYLAHSTARCRMKLMPAPLPAATGRGTLTPVWGPRNREVTPWPDSTDVQRFLPASSSPARTASRSPTSTSSSPASGRSRPTMSRR
jgi:nitrogen-specific signal transduction histidine kinase